MGLHGAGRDWSVGPATVACERAVGCRALTDDDDGNNEGGRFGATKREG